MYNGYLIYAPLLIAVFLIGWSADTYYNHRYDIGTSSSMNKYRLPREHILIRLKLFKYNNNFNYFLLIPYLIAWNLFFMIFIFYSIYWCGVGILANFFASKYVIFAMIILMLLYMGYTGFIQQKILNSNRIEKPNFKMEQKQKADKKDKLDK